MDDATRFWVIWHGDPEGDNAVDKGGHPMFFQAPPGLLPAALAQRLAASLGNIIIPGAEQSLMAQAKVLFAWTSLEGAEAYRRILLAMLEQAKAHNPSIEMIPLPVQEISESLLWDFIANPPARVRPVAGWVRDFSEQRGGDLIAFDQGPQGNPTRGS